MEEHHYRQIHYYRWLKMWGVHIKSERNLRNTSGQLVSTEVLYEAVPFSFPIKRGGEELRPAPLAYIPNLVAKVEELLHQNERFGTRTCFYAHILSCIYI